MAIALNTPRGEGYTACCEGKHSYCNPYTGIDNIAQWYEWIEGWYQAFNEYKFGVDNGRLRFHG